MAKIGVALWNTLLETGIQDRSREQAQMAKVFVSYSRENKELATALAKDIHELGHNAWLDQELSGGQAWWSEILSRVRRCDVFVVVLTPELLRSVACTREYGYAAALSRPILPVLAAGDVAVNLLPPQLARIQFVDYRQQNDRAVALRLARALSVLPCGTALPEPLPPEPAVPMSYLGGLNEQISGSGSLSYDQQSSLVLDLKRGLRDPETARDALELLVHLRRRRDLFAALAADIDEVLAVAPGSSGATARTSSKPRPPLGETAETLSPRPPPPQSGQGRQSGPAATTKNTTPPRKQLPPEVGKPEERAADLSVGWREKLSAAVVYGLVAALIAAGMNTDPIMPGLAAAFAGLMGGLRRVYMAVVVVGAVLGYLIGVAQTHSHAMGILYASGGVIIGGLVGNFLWGFWSVR
jgi:hypothetical protein